MIESTLKMLGPLWLLHRRIVVGIGILAAVILSASVGQISYLS